MYNLLFLVLASALKGAEAASVTLNAPPMGANTPVTGQMVGLTMPGYKGILIVSGDNGNTWWDKSHSRYLNLGVPDPGQAQNAGVPLNADGSFSWDRWTSSPYDNVASYMRFLILPSSFDLTWPKYQIEGIPIPGDVIAAAVAEGSVNRNTGAALTNLLPNTPAVPVPSVAASPAASAAASSAASPAASPAAGAGGDTGVVLTVSAPAIPLVTPITGKVAGLADPTTFATCIYVLSPENLWWGLKGNAPIAADGTFSAANWASDPHDVNEALKIDVFVVPSTYTCPQVVGLAIFPAELSTKAVALVVVARGNTASSASAASSSGTPTPVVTVPAGGVSLTVTSPAVPGVTPISGSTTGLSPATNYQTCIYVLSYEKVWWGLKGAAPLAADGTFSVANWATDPHDATAASIDVFLVPTSFKCPEVLGLAVFPADLTAAALLNVVNARGTTATGSGNGDGTGGGTTATPTPVPVASTSTGGGGSTGGTFQFVVNVPPIGDTGVVKGVAIYTRQAPSTYTVVVFTKDGNGNFFGPKAQATPGANGYFEVAGWATAGGDAQIANLGVFLMPAGTVIPGVGGQMPPNIMSAQVAYVVADRTAAQPALPAPVVWTAPTTTPTVVPTTPTGAGGEIAWPPATTGAKVNPGGKLQFGGYGWDIKDSGGGAVGPGPNVFVGDNNFVWTDNWGMHMNVRPRNGCGGWASSELTLDHSLGYGTYFFSTVSPVENLDPQVTIGLFLWDDTAGEGIGWREIDFEYARWGNGGDPTAAQFVLEPLRPGNLPGWKVRFFANQARTFGGAKGAQGGGGCNDDTDDQFNGAAVNRLSCALNWGPGLLKWYCWDGLYTLETVQNAQGRLLGSYNYAATQNVPPPGNERWHFNVWQANAGAPGWGRRVHAVVTGFQYTPNIVDFGAMGFGTNTGLGRLLAGRQLDTTANSWIDSTSSGNTAVHGAISRKQAFSDAVRRLSADVASTAGAPDSVSSTSAIGIAVGASTLTALAAAGIAFFVTSRGGFGNKEGRSFGLQSSGESTGESVPGDFASQHQPQARKQRHERVAPT